MHQTQLADAIRTSEFVQENLMNMDEKKFARTVLLFLERVNSYFTHHGAGGLHKQIIETDNETILGFSIGSFINIIKEIREIHNRGAYNREIMTLLIIQATTIWNIIDPVQVGTNTSESTHQN